MASRNYLKHTVSVTEPSGAALGDEWYHPVENVLYKRLVTNGTNVVFVPVLLNSSVDRFESIKVIVNVSSLTYDATATSGTTILLCNTTNNNVTINLPTAISNTAVYEIKKIGTANSMIIDGFSTQTIDGDQTITIVVENESLTLVSDNANWRVI